MVIDHVCECVRGMVYVCDKHEGRPMVGLWVNMRFFACCWCVLVCGAHHVG